MTVQQIRMCLEIEKQGSISKAAEKLFLSQPNLSRALRELEYELGIALFERTSFGVVPTSEGRRFLLEGKEIVQAMDALKDSFAQDTDSLLKISSVTCPLLAEELAQAISALPTPLKEIKISIDSNEDVLQNLSSGKAHLGIVRFPLSRAESIIERINRMGLSYRRWNLVKPQVTLAHSSWSEGPKLEIREIFQRGKFVGHLNSDQWENLPKISQEYLDLESDDLGAWLVQTAQSFTIEPKKNYAQADFQQIEIEQAGHSLHWLLWHANSPHEALVRAWNSEYDHTG
ncbi:MAG: LysR family transcriptional regulator [Firmicutes bacterium]|jgi:DNA-binding transcriptional LysR family regulator|nr:LysR family transcriptional regulator [Bacillota bacterium]